jgi:hypothetical protein
MSMTTAKAQLTKATKLLMLKWENANEHWDDPISTAIEKKHLDPLRDSVRAAIGAMDTMGEIIQHAKQDCS